MTFQLNGGRPGDERGFIHKKILGVAAKFGGAIPLVGGLVKTVATALTRDQQKERAKKIKLGNGNGAALPVSITGVGAGACIPPLRWSVLLGKCAMFLGGDVGPNGEAFAEVGNAVMGQYGAGLEPGSRLINRAICLRGMHLGNDGLCYNKSQITNKQRMWPAGRKPLLSGGDMRAISIAARAGRRMELATKRLQRMGMMKKPARRLAPHKHARAASNVVSV